MRQLVVKSKKHNVNTNAGIRKRNRQSRAGATAIPSIELTSWVCGFQLPSQRVVLLETGNQAFAAMPWQSLRQKTYVFVLGIQCLKMNRQFSRPACCALRTRPQEGSGFPSCIK